MSEFPSINNFDGMNYSPDASAGGGFVPPPSEMGGNPEQNGPDSPLKLFKDLVVRDFKPHLSERTFNSDDAINENEPKYDQYIRRGHSAEGWLEEARQIWEQRASGLRLPPELREQILDDTLDFWIEVGQAPAEGKSQNANGVAKMLAAFNIKLEERLEGVESIDDKLGTALRVTDALREYVNNPDSGKEIKGDLSLNFLKDKTEVFRRVVMREKKLAERMRRFEERVQALEKAGFEEGVLKSIRDDIQFHLLEKSVPIGPSENPEVILGARMVGLFGEDLTSENEQYWSAVVNEAYDRTRNSETISFMHKNLEGIVNKLQAQDKLLERQAGKQEATTFIETMVREVKKSHLLGKITPRLLEVLPQGVSLQAFNQEIMGLAVNLGIQVSEERVSLDWELASELAEGMKMSPEDMAQSRRMQQLGLQERGLEAYMFLPQTQEIMNFFQALPPEEQDQLSARLILKMVEGGRNSGMAQFELGAIMGDEKTSPVTFAYSETMDWIRKASEIKGYIDEKDVHRMFGFHNPESFALLNQEIDQTAWVKENGEWIRKDFNLKIKDVLGEIYSYEAMRELAANAGLGPDSFAAAKGKWLKVAILRAMGYRREDVLDWFKKESEYQKYYDTLVNDKKIEDAKLLKDIWEKRLPFPDKQYQQAQQNNDIAEMEKIQNLWDKGKNPFPEIGRTDRLSLANQQEFDGLGGLAGANWGMIMTAYNYMVWTHGDIELAPLEVFKRKPDQRSRGAEQDYLREFDKAVDVAQVLGMRPLLADYSSYVAKEGLVEPIQRFFKADNCSAEVLERRKNLVREIALINQPTPEGIKVLSMMVAGFGAFKPEGNDAKAKIDDWSKKVKQQIDNVSAWGVTRVRPFALWEKAITKEDGKLGELWSGFDFKPLMQQTGMNETEIQYCSTHVFDAKNNNIVELAPGSDGTMGEDGWKNFLHYANFSLYDLTQATFKTVDSEVRYRERAASTVGQMADFAGLEFPAHDSIDFLPISSEQLSTYAQFMIPEKTNSIKREEIEAYQNEPDADHNQFLGEEVNGSMKGLLENASKLNLGGFLQRVPTAMLYQEALRMHMEHNLMWNENVPLYALDVENEDFGAGNSKRLATMTRSKFKEIWKNNGIVGPDLQKVETVLQGYMYHFVEPIENNKGEDGQVLIGPNGSFTPIVATGTAIKQGIRDGVNKLRKTANHDMQLKMDRLDDTLDELDRFGGMCYAMLGGSANMPVWGYVVDGLFNRVGGNNYPSSFEQQLKGELMRFVEMKMVMSPAIQGPYALVTYKDKKGGIVNETKESKSFSLKK